MIQWCSQCECAMKYSGTLAGVTRWQCLREAGLPELAIDDVEHLLDDLLGALNSHVIQTHPRRVLEAIAARCERAARVLRSEPIP